MARSFVATICFIPGNRQLPEVVFLASYKHERKQKTWSMLLEPAKEPVQGPSEPDALSDHLVCCNQDRLWNRDAERLGGLQIHYQIELVWLSDRQVAWVGAFENLVHVAG